MATIRSDSNGNILQVLQTPFDEQSNPGPISNQAYELRIDETTNAALVADIASVTSEYLLLGQALTKNGNDVAPSPPSQVFADTVDSLPTILTKMQNGENLTTGEINAAVRIAFRNDGQL